MSEKEFFKKLFPPPYQYIKLDEVDIHIPQPFDYWDKSRTEEEGPVCECVGENTNKALFLYFQNLIQQGIPLPIYLNKDNKIMDGWHRYHAYYYLKEPTIPVYYNKMWRNHGFCWKKGIEGKRRLRVKTW